MSSRLPRSSSTPGVEPWPAALRLSLLLAASAGVGGCTALKGGDDIFGDAAGSTSGGSAGSGASGANGGSPPIQAGAANSDGGTLAELGGAGSGGDAAQLPCPSLEDRQEVRLPATAGQELELTADTHWTCRERYVLQGTVLVAPGVTLRIDPGVTVLGEAEALLFVERGGRLEAAGSELEPIVFTSAKPVGARKPGDFRGVVLAGDAPTHGTGTPVYNTLADHRAYFGGGPAGAAEGSCGSLRYVRVEFAGGNLDEADLPGAALTLAGCGSGTVVDFVQVHRGTDGIGILGGSVNLRHLLVTRNSIGNAIEWTGGYTGTLQFVIAQSLAASASILGSNSASDAEASPVSSPSVYNATLIGSPPPFGGGEHYGVLLQFGSRLLFKNSVVQGFSGAAFDLRLPSSVLENQVGAGKAIDISHVLLHQNIADYTLAAEVLAAMPSMRSKDPGLPAAADPTAPRFQPEDETVGIEVEAAPLPFDATASFRGALPFEGEDWTLGWTAFPAD